MTYSHEGGSSSSYAPKGWKNMRRSCASDSGSSIAAKWPRVASSLQRVTASSTEREPKESGRVGPQ